MSTRIPILFLIIPLMLMIILILMPILLLQSLGADGETWIGGIILIGPFPLFFQGEDTTSVSYLIPLLFIPILVFLLTIVFSLFKGRKPRRIALE